ncbi:MAG: amidase, partial [Clostridiales bacterium]|jgi:amidase|nr:amidase [Clostridiales bacterium]
MYDLKEITIRNLQKLYYDKKIRVREVVEFYLDRFHTLDQGKGGLNSVLEINPDAMEIAKDLDNRGYDQDQILYGVPVLLKDNIATADRMHTSAGSVALGDSIAIDDADVVKALRKQGALILGKTNMTEFANFMTKNMPAGYSSRGGKVLHPYNREKDPSGSSTGSAVAVAANLCMTSIGTDTSNSIVAPGLAHGIVGLRPSIGSISQRGIIPISFTLDTAGPFTRTVEDTAIMYAGLTDTPIVQGTFDLAGKTIAYNIWNMEKQAKETVAKTEVVLKELEKAGARIKRVHIEKTPHIMNLMKYEFKYGINQYLNTFTSNYPIKTLSDIIEYNRKHEKEALKYGQTYLIDAEETSGNMDEKAYLAVLQDREERKKKIREQLEGTDCCIMLSFNNILMYTGLPEITIPCGLDSENMPFGIAVTALTNEKLISMAYGIERIVGQRVEPIFR